MIYLMLAAWLRGIGGYLGNEGRGCEKLELRGAWDFAGSLG